MNYETPATFGDLLKAFRKRSRLTQQHLATILGVHSNTIGGWERGDVLPDRKGIVLELGKRLHLDDQEIRQLLEASLTALAPHWSVPVRRNLFFTGREEILGALHTRLSADQIVALTQSYAIHGLGGIGKTQLAVEYAYRHALDYTAVFWIAAESTENILSSFLAIAELLQLPERQDADQQRMVAALQRWLSRHSKWLLIWDNLEEVELLTRYLPPTRQGAILITTRRQALGMLAQDLELPTMAPEEGMLFLLRRAKVLTPQVTKEQIAQLAVSQPTEYIAAQEVVTALGGLPLALDQAAAYVEETGCSFADYLQRYEQQRKRLLDRRGGLRGDHPHSVQATFELARQRVEREHPAAADLLRVCAFLHAEAIPEEFLMAGASHLEGVHDGGESSESMMIDPYQLDQLIAALRTSSLVQRHPEKKTLSIHRLVQAVLREEMSEQEQTHWQQRVLHLLNALFPNPTLAPEVWEQCERLLPHVLAAVAAIPEQTQDQELAQVLRKAADYLRERAQYEQAEPLYQRALCILEQVVESEHPDVASSLNGLATLSRKQGKYELAESLYQRALYIREQTFGSEHPDVASLLNSLALLYSEQGKYELAEALYQQALHIWEQTLGPEHPTLAHSLTNLAELYRLQGKYEQAEPLYQRGLSLLEQAFGSQYPLIATPLYNLAILYSEQGKYEQAEPLYQQALHILEQSLGREHPDVAYPLINLAELYRLQGKYGQTRPLYERALSIWEQALGPEHSLVAYPLTNLAELDSEQGKYEQAELAYQRALSIWEQTLGPEHPNVAHPLNGLAALYTKQSRYTEAEFLFQRALQIRERALGHEHSLIAETLTGLATLYTEQRHYEQAMALFQRALALQKQHLGPQHPGIAEILYCLARFHQVQQQSTEALLLYQQALTVREQSLGPHHPKTVKTRGALLDLLEEMKRVEETIILEGQAPELESTSLCACGCGREIDTSKSRGEPRRFFSNACKQRFYRNASRRKRNVDQAPQATTTCNIPESGQTHS